MNFLADFCKENGVDMTNKVVTGWDATQTTKSPLRIKIIVEDTVNGSWEFVFTNIIELIAFSYQKTK